MRNRKFLKKCAGLALGMLLMLSISPMTEAAGETTAVGITKELQMPEGTATPSANFQFEFVYDGMKTIAGDAVLDKSVTGPAIPAVSIASSPTDTGTTKNGVKHVVKASENLLAGLDISQTKPGYYYYTVKEKAGTYAAAAGEQMDDSQAEYQLVLSLFVNADTGKTEIAGAAVIEKKKDNGTDGSGNKVDGAVNAKISATGELEMEDQTAYGNAFRFTNRFSRSAASAPDTENPNPEAPAGLDNLWIGKLVSGQLGDRTYAFPFTVTITNPVLMTSNLGTSYQAYIMERTIEDNGTVSAWKYVTEEAEAKKVSASAAAENGHYYVSLTAGMPANVNLKHNMALCVTALPVGAKFQVSETYGESDYTTTCKLLVNQTDMTGITTDTGMQLVGEDTNAVFFTNDKQASVMTGILVERLPYVLLLAAAAGILVLYMAVKSRKTRRKEG